MLKSPKFGPLKTDSYHKNTLRKNLEDILQYKLHNKWGGDSMNRHLGGQIEIFGVIFGQNLSI